VGLFTRIRDKVRENFVSRKDFSHDENSARCGRCAHLLPDETLTFCPRCGIPFSKVSPTTTYMTLAERSHVLQLQRYRFRLAFTTAVVFSAFWLLLASFSTLQTESLLSQLRPTRPIEIYMIDDPAYPTLDTQTQIESVAVAVQSVESHFGVHVSEVTIRRDSLPPVLQTSFPDLWQNQQRSSLSFWESQIFPRLTPKWDEVGSLPLPVLFTNIPIVNDLGRDASLETAHLNSFGLVSGLGHPSLSVVSSYRMLREEHMLFGRPKSDADNKRLQARFMGEYVFAHELGHALLALPDYVDRARLPAQVALRGPASLDSDEADYANCLMHTDPGGGYHAWNAIRRRVAAPTGNACPDYQSVLTAFKLRAQAIAALQAGDRDRAAALYTQVLSVYDPPSKTWLRHQWEQENKLFLSLIQRWWSGVSLHD
jgi:hypothetical protein